MMKIVVEVSLSSSKASTIFKTVAKLNGIKSIKLDEKKGRITIVGNVDPVDIIEALRKKDKNAKIISVGPPEPERQSLYVHPYYNWSDASQPVYPYNNYWNESYKPVQYPYASAPYEGQPSGCVIV